MVVMMKPETLRNAHFLRGLNEEEIAKISALCKDGTFEAGELCQKEGEPVKRVNFIIKGKIGVEFHLPGLACENRDLVLYTLEDGGVFGWSALIEGVPWSTLRVFETTTVKWIDADALLNLCETDNHIGYILMRNLSSLIASRLRRNRMATLSAIAAIR
jgi:CRP/FNR family transcriptional regulator, cyclic AMP receptor protein